MERRGANTWIIAALALAVGFLAALLIFGGNGDDNASATVTTAGPTATTPQAPGSTTTSTGGTSQQGTAPQSPAATEDSCINLWNSQNNRANQTFLVNIMTQQPVRVHVGLTSDVPPKCLVTIVGNNGSAYVFPEGGGTTFP